MKLLQKPIHQRYGGGAIHIVIAVNEDFLLFVKSLLDALQGFVHIAH
jgi:hypothetical protein